MHRFYMIQSFTQFHRYVSIIFYGEIPLGLSVAAYFMIGRCYWTMILILEFRARYFKVRKETMI